MRSYASLSDHDFELLVADLFGVAESVRYEAYARGPDLGEDLRHERADGTVDVVQCKHYVQSSFAQLRAAARAEARKLSLLSVAPASYRFVTSRRLTRQNKRLLREDLSPFIERPSDIWGEDDLELLLARSPEVEQRHIKLWLPSSPQLHAVINAGTYARSRVLAEEILGALPRWVPSRAFDDARQILRRNRVCVIAGVPGIGKTTLAKMLLGDAIHDSYEAIQVSADVEEAWEINMPGRKQVFYYDDFLGRTALTERLGKNEEDRLLAFMRHAAESQTTLFILTTREYILQQAKQLYEQLNLEGIDGRKFLLRLDHYSRLDRARIFYNHAFISGQLSKDARRALFTSGTYAKIIDHPAYNPRQIEWITGLSGHRLTSADNSEYVSFAMAALDDPARIWRYGFEQQLNDVQRILLLALATMPDRVEHDDLERAFNGLCKAAKVDTRGRAFERSLEVLDDSFIRTYHDVGKVFICVSNPAVEDFLLGYLASNKTEGRIAIRGAVFFEQVEKLARVLAAPEIPPSSVATDFVRSLTHCFTMPSCSWQGVYYGREATEATTERVAISFEDRCEFIGRVLGWGPPYNARPLRGAVRALYIKAVKTVISRWRLAKGDKEDAIRLLGKVRERAQSMKMMIGAAKTLFASGLHYPYAFTYLIRFRSLFPNGFNANEWKTLQNSYLQIAQAQLEDWTELDGVGEVSDIERYAQQMSVELDEDLVQSTRERVEERIGELEGRGSQDSEDRPASEDIAAGSHDDEIAALFSRLADDD